MQNSDLARWRLRSQHISQPTLRSPGEVVAWLGAVQAQDYLAALWAIGMRMSEANASAVEQAIADKTIVRTWRSEERRVGKGWRSRGARDGAKETKNRQQK